MLNLAGGSVIHRLQPVQENVGDAPVMLYFTSLRDYLPTRAGVLEHCRDGQTTSFFFVFRGYSSLPHAQGDERCPVQKFLSCSKYCKLDQQLPETF
jgi:hypothetical protein